MPRTIANIPDNVWDPGTAKRCMPFADAMTLGYMLLLPVAVRVTVTEDGPQFTWRPGSWKPVEAHAAGQTRGISGGKVYKWVQPWALLHSGPAISYLYTHPLNRPDLPFRSFSGVVSSRFGSPVNMPFQWHGGATVLDAGTPIAQVIPLGDVPVCRGVVEIEHALLFRDVRRATAQRDGYRRVFGRG